MQSNKTEREELLHILGKPYETTETRLAGGILDWQMTFTKEGMEVVVDKLLAFQHRKTLQSRIDELNNLPRGKVNTFGYVGVRVTKKWLDQRLAELQSQLPKKERTE